MKCKTYLYNYNYTCSTHTHTFADNSDGIVMRDFPSSRYSAERVVSRDKRGETDTAKDYN